MLSSDFVLRRHGENSFLICVFLFFVFLRLRELYVYDIRSADRALRMRHVFPDPNNSSYY